MRVPTPEEEAAILTMVTAGAPYQLASLKAGVDGPTAQAWLEEGALAEDGPLRGFALAVRKAELKTPTRSLDLIRKAARDGNADAVAWLKKHGYAGAEADPQETR